MSRTSEAALIAFLTALVAVVGWVYVHKRMTVSKLQPPSTDKSERPPGAPPPIHFSGMSADARRDFLNVDYTILSKVSDLPAGIKKLYAVSGTSRVAMADPGQQFEATDVITDPELPTRRLIFAGVAGDRVFVHYERGGIGLSHLVALFRLKSPDLAVGLWSGYRGRAKDFEELKRMVSKDDPCSDP